MILVIKGLDLLVSAIFGIISCQIKGNNMDRKTPINFNNQFNDNFSSNNNLNQLFKNNQFNQPDQAALFNAMKNMQNNPSSSNNEEQAQKIRSFLEKMNQNPGSSQQLQESSLKSESAGNPMAMLSMLQQQQGVQQTPALPKLPPTKVYR